VYHRRFAKPIAGVYTGTDWRARSRKTSHFWPPIHPGDAAPQHHPDDRRRSLAGSSCHSPATRGLDISACH